MGNPHLTEAQRSALTTPIPESGFTRTNDQKTLRAMLFASDEQYRAHAVARNGDLIHAAPELEDLVRTDPLVLWHASNIRPLPVVRVRH